MLGECNPAPGPKVRYQANSKPKNPDQSTEAPDPSPNARARLRPEEHNKSCRLLNNPLAFRLHRINIPVLFILYMTKSILAQIILTKIMHGKKYTKTFVTMNGAGFLQHPFTFIVIVAGCCTKGREHRNISVIFNAQNIFHQVKGTLA